MLYLGTNFLDIKGINFELYILFKILLQFHTKYLYCRLAEVGKLETPKLQGKYETGQLILHRVFGYRGVILFPWVARIYDRDIPIKREE